jgi:aminoglycoside phosphotransferase (APT) family kinase protein
MDAARLANLGRWLSGLLGSACEVSDARPLTGGAIQENWLLTVIMGQSRHEFVLRKDAPAPISASHSREREFALLKLVHEGGAKVPEPIGFCSDASVIGAPFALMAKLEGTGFGPHIVRDAALGGDRERLVHDIGAELARIHAIRPPQTALAFLGEVPVDFVAADIATLRAGLDAMGIARPALEWSLRHCERRLAASGFTTLIHRDLRTGNYMVDEKGLTGILDWEFAGWGDPMSDLGWFCAGCWRFGRNDLEAGGVGSRASFYDGYRAGGGVEIDDARVRLWEIMAHLRWAMIALQQGQRHLSGKEPSLALALTSRIVPELELAALRVTVPPPGEPLLHIPTSPAGTGAGEAMGADLLAVANTTLAEKLLPKLAGEDRTTALMIASAMRMASRELAAGQTSKGNADAAPLAASIRAGQCDDDAACHKALLIAAIRAVALTRPDILFEDERALL